MQKRLRRIPYSISVMNSDLHSGRCSRQELLDIMSLLRQILKGPASDSLGGPHDRIDGRPPYNRRHETLVKALDLYEIYQKLK